MSGHLLLAAGANNTFVLIAAASEQTVTMSDGRLHATEKTPSRLSWKAWAQTCVSRRTRTINERDDVSRMQ